MPQQYPYSWKQCATCAYWTGVRETNVFGEHVNVESPMAKGICKCRGSGWFNQPKQANSSCLKFEKWVALK